MIKAYFSNIKDVLLQNIQFSKQSINVAVAWFTQRELFVAILDALDRGVSVSIILIDDIINRNEYGLDFSLFIRKGGNLRFADSWKSWRGGEKQGNYQSRRFTSSFFISSSIFRYRAKARLPSECPDMEAIRFGSLTCL